MEKNKFIIHEPVDKNNVPDSRGIGMHYFEILKVFSDKVGQIVAETGATQTYGEILQKSIRVALKMQSIGITASDVICFSAYNISDLIYAYFGTIFTGAKVAALDPELGPDEIKYLLNLVKPTMVFSIPESLAEIEKGLEQNALNPVIAVFGTNANSNHVAFKDFLLPHSNEHQFQPEIARNVFDTAMIIFSSGTSGLPKGISLNHYGILYHSEYMRKYYTLEKCLYYTSLYWISHIVITTMCLMSGGCRVISRTYDESKVLENIERYNITFLFMSPSSSNSLTANATNYIKSDVSSLKSMMIGGSIISEYHIHSLQKLFPYTRIIHVYGMTESAGPITICVPMEDAEKINSCGRIVSGYTVKVVDVETDAVVGANKHGELRFKSKCCMNEYYNQPELTKTAFDEDGYIRTGDVGYYDEDLYFYIVGRTKEMFKYKSWHIIPAELENILLQHSAIAEAVVIGTPHQTDGDLPTAVIITKQNVAITDVEIINYVNDKVIDKKRLRGGVKFVQMIPKTATGKYNRRALHSMIKDGSIL